MPCEIDPSFSQEEITEWASDSRFFEDGCCVFSCLVHDVALCRVGLVEFHFDELPHRQKYGSEQNAYFGSSVMGITQSGFVAGRVGMKILLLLILSIPDWFRRCRTRPGKEES